MKSILLSIIIILMTATGYAGFTRGPFSGRVIDAETKKPVEGAVVMATYYVAGSIIHGVLGLSVLMLLTRL